MRPGSLAPRGSDWASQLGGLAAGAHLRNADWEPPVAVILWFVSGVRRWEYRHIFIRISLGSVHAYSCWSFLDDQCKRILLSRGPPHFADTRVVIFSGMLLLSLLVRSCSQRGDCGRNGGPGVRGPGLCLQICS